MGVVSLVNFRQDEDGVTVHLLLRLRLFDDLRLGHFYEVVDHFDGRYVAGVQAW